MSSKNARNNVDARQRLGKMGATAYRTSTRTVLAGQIISALVVLFLLFDSVTKALNLAPAVEGTVQLGYPEDIVVELGSSCSAVRSSM